MKFLQKETLISRYPIDSGFSNRVSFISSDKIRSLPFANQNKRSLTINGSKREGKVGVPSRIRDAPMG